jgi:uncharacterized protein (DUF1800 family)
VASATRALQDARRMQDASGIREAMRSITQVLLAEQHALIVQRVASDTPFVERLVAFWSNHLCVSVAGNKPPVVPVAGAYEREAIRPHVLGSFTDMVLASARHPAMLLYLDNAQSIGPSSPAVTVAAQRAVGQARGLNENYARELLELHTLGVDGGYSQQDVLELARILTGWTISGQGPRQGDGVLAFVYRPAAHEPGIKTVLGRRYGEVGEAVAGKLVRHFVSDDPPPAAVERVAATFRDSGGDLLAVARTLIDLDEAWDPMSRKFRTPQDWVVAALRALGARERVPSIVVNALDALRHRVWAPPAPKGFGDTLAEWADPDSLMNRAEMARSIAQALPGGPDPRRLLSVLDLPAGDPLPGLLADGRVHPIERVAVALAGPAFQWR